jgi:hypothetical protein
MLLFLLAHLCEVAIEIVEPVFPLLAKGLHPVGNILESRRHQPAWSPLRVTPAFDETRVLQHLEMLGDRRLAEFERRQQFRYRRFARRETGQDRSSRGIGKGREGSVQPVGGFINCHTSI